MLLRSPEPGSRIIHITAARRLGRLERPEIEPPVPVASLFAKVPEKDRAIIAVAEVRLDLRQGDLDMVVLRKCNYVFQHAQQAFPTQSLRFRLVRSFVDIVRDYGEPEGVPLLQDVLKQFGQNRNIRYAVSSAVSYAGTGADLDILLNLIRMDVVFPGPHLDALLLFANSNPASVPRILKELEGFSGHNGFSETTQRLSELLAH